MAFVLTSIDFQRGIDGFLSKETIELHYGKHHRGYVDKLNELVAGTEYDGMSIEDTVIKSYRDHETSIFNNAGQHYNHDFYWKCISPKTDATIASKILVSAIEATWGTVEKMKEEFIEKGKSLFGSGWIWLASNAANELELFALEDAKSPLVLDRNPLLTCDVWEHAYYVDFRNEREKYLHAFWNHVAWDFVGRRFDAA